MLKIDERAVKLLFDYVTVFSVPKIPFSEVSQIVNLLQNLQNVPETVTKEPKEEK